MTLLYVVIALIVVAVAARVITTYLPAEGRMKAIPNIVLALLLVGMVLFLINSYIPMAGSIKAILNIVVVVATCVGVLQAVGLWGQVIGIWGKLMSAAHLK
jgi:predicted membrane protein